MLKNGWRVGNMRKKIYLIHGFNVKDDGAATTGQIREMLEGQGYDVIEIKYGWWHRLRVRWCNKGLAKAIASMTEPGSYCIAHSNGGALAYLAAEEGAQWKKVVLVNPALDEKKALADHIQGVQVWYAPHDKWTGIAKWIPNSVWGAQGRKGYTGPEDPRYQQINEEAVLGRFQDEHSGLFHSQLAKRYFTEAVHVFFSQ